MRYMDSDLLTIAEAAYELGLSTARLRVLVRNGTLVGTKKGRDWLVEQSSVLAHQNDGGIRIPPRLRIRVLIRDKGECQDGGFSPAGGDGLNVHHVEERKNGGGDALSNLITLCRSCHLKRHGRQEGQRYPSKTISLDDEVWAALDRLKKEYGSYNKGLKVISDNLGLLASESYKKEELK